MTEEPGPASKTLRWIAGFIIFFLVLFSLFPYVVGAGGDLAVGPDEESRTLSAPKLFRHKSTTEAQHGDRSNTKWTTHAPAVTTEAPGGASVPVIARARKCDSDQWGSFSIPLSETLKTGLNLCAENKGNVGYFRWTKIERAGEPQLPVDMSCTSCSRLKLSNLEVGMYRFRLRVTRRPISDAWVARGEASRGQMFDTTTITVTVLRGASGSSSGKFCGKPNVIDGWWIAESSALLSPVRHSGATSTITETYPEGAALILRCNSGSRVSNGGKMRCLDGKWDPDPETVCVKQLSRCQFPSSANANIEIIVNKDPVPGYRIRSGLVEGSEVRMSCNTGDNYLSVSRDLGFWTKGTFLCQKNGAWKVLQLVSGELVESKQQEDVTVWNPECKPAQNMCHRMTELEKTSSGGMYRDLRVRYPGYEGYIRRSGGSGEDMYPEGSVMSVECRSAGYSLYPRSSGRRRCLANGTWEFSNRRTYCAKRMGCDHLERGRGLKYAYLTEDCEGDRFHCIYTLDENTGQTLLKPGTRARWECYNPSQYRLVGEYVLTCGQDGEWTPKERPSCELENRCGNPQFPTNGYYSGGDREMLRFEPGQHLEFGCAEGFHLEGPTVIRCLNDGSWSNGRPKCNPGHWNNKKFIAMATVGCLLGILLVILMAFLIQRQRLIRRAQARRRRLVDQPSEPRLSASQVIAAAAGRRSSAGAGGGTRFSVGGRSTGSAAEAQRLTAGDWMDPDRLALIAFAEGNGLPSYEEAVSDVISSRRGPPQFDAVSTLSGYASRAVRRLPSLSSLRSREAAPTSRPLGGHGGGAHGPPDPRDPHYSVSGSNVSHGAISGQIGSAETMGGTSDGSTLVTLETLSTSTGHTPSVRAQAGSLSSVQPPSEGSAADAVPLLEAEEGGGDSSTTDFGGGCVRGVEEGGGGSVNLTADEEEGMEMLETEDKTLDV